MNPEENAQLHTGHRQRLLESYLTCGLDGLSDVEVLELALTYAIPRKDTNELAHRLLLRFGSLPAVLEAPPVSTVQVQGMTERAAALLHLLPELWRRYDLCRQQKTVFFTTTAACGDFLEPFFRGLREERVRLLCLDAKCRLLDCRELSVGSVNTAAMPVRRIVEAALAVNATSVVLAHNHTSGVALPSREDIDATERLKTALDCVDVILADHIIVADGDYVSMRDSGLL